MCVENCHRGVHLDGQDNFATAAVGVKGKPDGLVAPTLDGEDQTGKTDIGSDLVKEAAVLGWEVAKIVYGLVRI